MFKNNRKKVDQPLDNFLKHQKVRILEGNSSPSIKAKQIGSLHSLQSELLNLKFDINFLLLLILRQIRQLQLCAARVNLNLLSANFPKETSTVAWFISLALLSSFSRRLLMLSVLTVGVDCLKHKKIKSVASRDLDKIILMTQSHQFIVQWPH